GTNQPQGLLVRLQAWLLQQQAGEHAEKTGADCRQRTEQTFGIPGAVPFPPGQVLRVDPVGEVRVLRVGPPRSRTLARRSSVPSSPRGSPRMRRSIPADEG